MLTCRGAGYTSSHSAGIGRKQRVASTALAFAISSHVDSSSGYSRAGIRLWIAAIKLFDATVMIVQVRSGRRAVFVLLLDSQPHKREQIAVFGVG